jgi:hypothetical protein
MSNPIDIIAQSIRDNDGVSANMLARIVTDHLTDGSVVEAAVAALKAEGWEETHEGPLGIGTLSDEDLTNIARTVLRSVGGA